MSKHNSTKEALARWEEENDMEAADARVVKLCGMNPPIEKMDNALGQLVNCEQLSLSTNNIEKIAFLANLRNLKILSMGRNHIKSFAGLEAVGDVLEQLWISYNFIEKTKGISVLKKLKVLYMSNNLVKSVYELSRLKELPRLTELVMVGNPIEESYVMKEQWLQYVSEMLPRLTKLDGQVIIRREEAPPSNEDSP